MKRRKKILTKHCRWTFNICQCLDVSNGFDKLIHVSLWFKNMLFFFWASCTQFSFNSCESWKSLLLCCATLKIINLGILYFLASLNHKFKAVFAFGLSRLERCASEERSLIKSFWNQKAAEQWNAAVLLHKIRTPPTRNRNRLCTFLSRARRLKVAYLSHHAVVVIVCGIDAKTPPPPQWENVISHHFMQF